jgi:hypothetical protein
MAKKQSSVYFIQATDGGAIKIGVTTNVMKRLATLRTGSGRHLNVLGIIRDGTRETERMLHRRFKDGRLIGEWFRPEPDLLEYIRDHASRWDESEHFGKGRHLAFVPPSDGLGPSRLVASGRGRPTDEQGKRKIQDEAIFLMADSGYPRWQIAIITGLPEEEIIARLTTEKWSAFSLLGFNIE